MTNINPNFIGTFQIDTNLCDKIVDFFNENKSLQSKGETVNGVDEAKKKSIDIGINQKSV